MAGVATVVVVRGVRHDLSVVATSPISCELGLALDASVRAHLGAGDEIVQDLDPRVVTRQVVVEFGCHLLHLGQSVAGYVGEVVVLVVVAHVEGDQIERAVVRVGLVALDEHVVLGDEVAGDGVEAETEQKSEPHVAQRLDAKEVEDGVVEHDLDDPVGHLEAADGLREHHDRSQGVQQRLKNDKAHLAHHGREEHGLNFCGQIGVDLRVALVLVMIQMVLLEGDGGGHAERQIGQEADKTVGHGSMGAED